MTTMLLIAIMFAGIWGVAGLVRLVDHLYSNRKPRAYDKPVHLSSKGTLGLVEKHGSTDGAGSGETFKYHECGGGLFAYYPGTGDGVWKCAECSQRCR